MIRKLAMLLFSTTKEAIQKAVLVRHNVTNLNLYSRYSQGKLNICPHPIFTTLANIPPANCHLPFPAGFV